MSIISATRRGFLYQDRFAVAAYLKQLQGKNIKEYFIDFPVGRKSLDVRYLDAHGGEVVYEVKSGEEFKRDARKKESSEVRDAFLNLKEYLDLKPSVKLNLVIRRGFVENITSYWDRLTAVCRHPFPRVAVELAWLGGKLRLPGVATRQNLYDFCQQVAITDAGDDMPNNGGDPFADIDDDVLQKINDLAAIFGANVCQYEYPPQILMFDLYHQCRLYAGLGVDVHPIFTASIVEFLAHRKFLDVNYTPGNNRGRSKEDLLQETTQQVAEYLEEPAPGAAPGNQAPQYVPEGGVTQ